MKNEIEVKYDENGHDVIFTFRGLSEKEILANAQKSRKSMKAWVRRNSGDIEDFDLIKSRYLLFMASMVKFEGLKNVDLVELLNPNLKGQPEGWDFTKPEAEAKKNIDPSQIDVPFNEANKEMLCRSIGVKLALTQEHAIEQLDEAKKKELREELKNLKR